MNGIKSSTILSALHCESGEGLWLQGEAALQAYNFRYADPQPVIPLNEKKNNEIFPKQLISGIKSADELFLPWNTWQCSDVQYFRSSQHVP